MREISVDPSKLPATPFKVGEKVQIGRTIYKIADIVKTPIGIYLVDMEKEKDGSQHQGKWSVELNAFINISKKAKNAGPTRLQALFEVSGK